MLTGWEKVIFVLVLLGSLGAARSTFGNMFKIIARGPQPLDWSLIPGRLFTGFKTLFGASLFKTRLSVTIIHTIVSWGFILYMLVNLVDILYGLIPDFSFMASNWLGNVYRIFVDIFSVLVLLGIIYFVVRRFIMKDGTLVIPEVVLMAESTRKGVHRDSAIVAGFIFLHVGFRFVGASFELAQHHSDGFQPAASALAGLWAGMTPEALVFWEHASWWLAIGLILAFIPSFPYTKHAHLFMGPLNHMVMPARRSPAALETIDFEDENIEQYGVALLEHLPQKEILDAYACIMCNRCQEVCPAYNTGKVLSPAALEINKRYLLNTVGSKTPAELPDTPLLEFAINAEAVWACTACGAVF